MDADRQQAIRERADAAKKARLCYGITTIDCESDRKALLAALAEAEATIGRVEALCENSTARNYSDAWVTVRQVRAALDGGRRDGDETGEGGL